MIVARDQRGLYDDLSQVSSPGELTIILDRRREERRQAPRAGLPERRRAERRRGGRGEDLATRGFVLITGPPEPPPETMEGK
jgi:hypothetical protein